MEAVFHPSLHYMGKIGIISALRRSRAWLGQALIVAFVLKALIPAGFMPEFSKSGDGSFKIVICTANGTKIISTDADGVPHGKTIAKHAGEPCAVGALAAFPLPDAVAGLVPIRPVQEIAAAIDLAVVIPPARAGPAHAPRGPPSFLVL